MRAFKLNLVRVPTDGSEDDQTKAVRGSERKMLIVLVDSERLELIQSVAAIKSIAPA